MFSVGGDHLLLKIKESQPCEVGFIFIFLTLEMRKKKKRLRKVISNMPKVTVNECWSQDSKSSLFNSRAYVSLLVF